MHERYTQHTRLLVDGILESPGETSAELRRAVEARAAQLSGRTSAPAEQVPPDLQRYIDKVALHAYKITDQDIKTLQAAGYSEDALFELTLSAALGAGMARLASGLRALKGDDDASESH